MQSVIVTLLVIAAAASATWRLAGASGRLRLLHAAANVLRACGARRLATRVEAARARRAAQGSLAACGGCSAGTAAKAVERDQTR